MLAVRLFMVGSPVHAAPQLAAPPCFCELASLMARDMQDALASLGELARCAALTADLAALLEGQQLAAGLASGDVKEGAKLPLLPVLAPPAPPPAPAPAPAAASTPAPAKPGFAPGFLSSPAARQQKQREAANAGVEQPDAAAAPMALATGPAASEAAGSAALQSPAAEPHGGTPSSSSSSSAATEEPTAAAPQPPGLGSRASSVGSSPAPSPAVDPLHQLVARSDPNQGVYCFCFFFF